MVPQPLNNSTQRPGSVVGRLWLVRWLLVLLLVWDQVGSPLHHHRHDSGIDGQWLSGSSQSEQARDATEGNAEVRIVHAVLAIRPTSAVAPTDAPPQAQDIGDHFLLPVDFTLAAPDPDGRPSPRLHPAAPHPVSRSLPPASRAPPLHA